jgi:deltex-like protein
VIDYDFKSGINPQTGNQFNGIHVTAFVPDTAEGREIVTLLVKAFKLKLTFTVSKNNTLNWNGISHKTSISGFRQNNGYPDPTYFSTVKSELA